MDRRGATWRPQIGRRCARGPCACGSRRGRCVVVREQAGRWRRTRGRHVAPCDWRATPTPQSRSRAAPHPRVPCSGHAARRCAFGCRVPYLGVRKFQAPENVPRTSFFPFVPWPINRHYLSFFGGFGGFSRRDFWQSFFTLSTTLSRIVRIFGGCGIDDFCDSAHCDVPLLVASSVAVQSASSPGLPRRSFEPIFVAAHS